MDKEILGYYSRKRDGTKWIRYMEKDNECLIDGMNTLLIKGVTGWPSNLAEEFTKLNDTLHIDIMKKHFIRYSTNSEITQHIEDYFGELDESDINLQKELREITQEQFEQYKGKTSSFNRNSRIAFFNKEFNQVIFSNKEMGEQKFEFLYCRFNNCKFVEFGAEGTKLIGSRFNDCVFQDSNFKDTQMQGTEHLYSTFKNTNLENSNCSLTYMRNSVFADGVNLSGIDVTNSNFSGVFFREVDLEVKAKGLDSLNIMMPGATADELNKRRTKTLEALSTENSQLKSKQKNFSQKGEADMAYENRDDMVSVAQAVEAYFTEFYPQVMEGISGTEERVNNIMFHFVQEDGWVEEQLSNIIADLYGNEEQEVSQGLAQIQLNKIEYVLEKNRQLYLEDIIFDEEGYLTFTTKIEGEELEGTFRVYDPLNGADMELIDIERGLISSNSVIREEWSMIQKYLSNFSRQRYEDLTHRPDALMQTPILIVKDSESPKFEDGEKIPLKIANERLFMANASIGNQEGYEKVNFEIYFYNELGKINSYLGKYDVGVESKDLIGHIRQESNNMLKLSEEAKQAYIRINGEEAFQKDIIELHQEVLDSILPIFESACYPDGRTVETNMGEIPIEDYLDIAAAQNGFENYADMKANGYVLGEDYTQEQGRQETEKGFMENLLEEEKEMQSLENTEPEKEESKENAEVHFQGYAYAKGQNKPTILYGNSEKEIIGRLQSYNQTRNEDNRFITCNIGSLNNDSNKYQDFQKYDVISGMDVTPLYLKLPHLKKEEFTKLTEYLKENGAKYNPRQKKWYITRKEDLNKFAEYLEFAPEQKESTKENIKEVNKEEGKQAEKLQGETEKKVFAYEDKNFNKEQFDVIQRGIDAKLFSDQIKLFARNELSSAQMEEIRFSIQDGLSERQISMFAKTEMQPWQMDLCRVGMQHGIEFQDLSKIIEVDSELSWCDKRNMLDRLIKELKTPELERKQESVEKPDKGINSIKDRLQAKKDEVQNQKTDGEKTPKKEEIEK